MPRQIWRQICAQLRRQSAGQKHTQSRDGRMVGEQDEKGLPNRCRAQLQ